MSLYPPPEVLTCSEWSRLPERFRKTDAVPHWARANAGGRAVDSFLEGPVIDPEGRLWLVDIPYGRLFTLDAGGSWEEAYRYDGWPNGLVLHADGRLFIADYRRGILCYEPATGRLSEVVTERHSESFRGCNDLILDRAGRCLYFTDQGQSGLQMPNGRVYRFDLQSERLDLLIDSGVSPNGLALSRDESALYVGMTRANAVWRLPLLADGTVTKVGLFVQLSGGFGGPDGLLVDSQERLLVAHVGNGCLWIFDRRGWPLFRADSPAGLLVTNVTEDPARPGRYLVTESETGAILELTV